MKTKIETIKQVEIKINEIEQELQEQKELLANLKKEKDYQVGDVIKYNNLDWFVIEIKKESLILITKEILFKELIQELFTDKRMVVNDFVVRFSRDGSNNDWRDSYIRQVLNTKFLERFNIDDLVLMKTKYDKDKVSQDYIRLPLKEEMESKTLNIRKISDPFGYWTMSPRHFRASRTSANEFFLNSAGIVSSYWVAHGNGVRAVIELRTKTLEKEKNHE